MAPRPPKEISESGWMVIFSPCHSLSEWLKSTILNQESELYNPDHDHLSDAVIGFIWTNQDNSRRGKRVVGMAEEPVFRCGKWQKGRQELQLMEWFGVIPDFLITLDANYCSECSESELLSLIEHELYHCAQAVDSFGMPKFNQDTGLPSYTLAGHDVEEFVGVVRRYGIGSAEGKLAELVRAANDTPEFSNERVSHLCGNCIN